MDGNTAHQMPELIIISGGMLCWLSGLASGMVIRYFRSIILKSTS